MLPRRDPDSDVHVSYHRDGRFHTKTLLPSRGYHDRPISRARRQPLTAIFKGVEHVANLKGHGKGTGEVCDPKAFDGVVYVEPGVGSPGSGRGLCCGRSCGTWLQTKARTWRSQERTVPARGSSFCGDYHLPGRSGPGAMEVPGVAGRFCQSRVMPSSAAGPDPL